MSFSIATTPKQGSFGITATPNDGMMSNNGGSVSGPATGSLTQQPSFLDSLTYHNFKVAHQRVSLDVQLQDHSIKGIADIIIIPLIKNLDYITFDCKDLNIKDVWIENRRCEHYIHDNPIKNYMNKFINTHSQGKIDESDILYNNNSIEQSHFLRNKFADLNEFPQEKNKCQLMIKIPSTIKIKLQDTSTLANYTPITPSIRSTPQTFQQDAVFTPLTIRIAYDIKEPTTGVNFDTLDEDKPYLWNAYTTNNELCSTASYWMPCVDSFEEKSTWEIEISVPKKVKNIGTSKIIGQQDQQQPRATEKNNNSNSNNNNDNNNNNNGEN